MCSDSLPMAGRRSSLLPLSIAVFALPHLHFAESVLLYGRNVRTHRARREGRVKARVKSWRWGPLGLLCGLALLLGTGGGRPAAAGPPGRELPSWVDAPDRIYFPETGHHLVDPFLYYWRANGGRAVFGLPISESRAGAGGQSTVQYFERAVLEYRPNTG